MISVNNQTYSDGSSSSESLRKYDHIQKEIDKKKEKKK
jgi:hypothetical protein